MSEKFGEINTEKTNNDNNSYVTELLSQKIELKKDIFKDKNLYEIKEFINANENDREKFSLIFLIQAIQDGYKLEAGENINLIRNFTPADIKVVSNELVRDDQKIDFIYDGVSKIDIIQNNNRIGMILLNNSVYPKLINSILKKEQN